MGQSQQKAHSVLIRFRGAAGDAGVFFDREVLLGLAVLGLDSRILEFVERD